MFQDEYTPYPSYSKKVLLSYLSIDFFIELAIGFYLAIDYKVLNLNAGSIFYYLGILFFINIFGSLGILIKGFSIRNWYLVSRTRLITFLILFIVFVTAAPGIINDRKFYIATAFGAFYIIAIIYNLIAIWIN